MNICLTSFCNNHCPYCFQEDFQNKPIEEWKLEDINKFIEWGKYPYLKVLGGEPTLYSHFNEFIDLLEQHDSIIKKVCFISNLLGPTSAYHKVGQIKRYHCAFLINVTYDDDKEKIFQSNLNVIMQYPNIEKTLGITLMPNIKFNQKNIDRLFYYIENYDFQSIRLGLMVPKPSDKLTEIYNYDKELIYFTQKILNSEKSKNIMIYFDCALNFCQISLEILNLIKQLPNVEKNIKLDCKNGAPLDVWPNHQIVFCSSSTGDFIKYRMEDFISFEDCLNTLIKMNNEYKIANKKCLNCDLFIKNICHPCHSFDQALLRGERVDV